MTSLQVWITGMIVVLPGVIWAVYVQNSNKSLGWKADRWAWASIFYGVLAVVCVVWATVLRLLP